MGEVNLKRMQFSLPIAWRVPIGVRRLRVSDSADVRASTRSRTFGVRGKQPALAGLVRHHQAGCADSHAWCGALA